MTFTKPIHLLLYRICLGIWQPMRNHHTEGERKLNSVFRKSGREIVFNPSCESIVSMVLISKLTKPSKIVVGASQLILRSFAELCWPLPLLLSVDKQPTPPHPELYICNPQNCGRSSGTLIINTHTSLLSTLIGVRPHCAMCGRQHFLFQKYRF